MTWTRRKEKIGRIRDVVPTFEGIEMVGERVRREKNREESSRVKSSAAKEGKQKEEDEKKGRDSLRTGTVQYRLLSQIPLVIRMKPLYQ